MADTEPKAVDVTALSTRSRRRSLFYLGLLVLFVAFCDPNEGLIAIPLGFILKNKLHFEAHELSAFRLVAAIPLYLSFVFGFARDTWSPLGLMDRGYVIIFSAMSAAFYVFFAFVPVTYSTILAAVFLLTCYFLFIDSAKYGLSSTLARQHVMSGQVSVLWSVFTAIPTVAAFVIGGRVSDVLEAIEADAAIRIMFMLAAALFVALSLYGIWKPRSVFEGIHDEHPSGTHVANKLKQFVGHWPIYPALVIWLLFKFAPGVSTPLQYYLQDTLNARDHVWGEWNAIFYASRIPVYVVYGLLCRRFPLKSLVWIGTFVTIPQFLPLLFVDSVTQALIAAALIGIMGAIANAAYLDLIIRSCPNGLQGTTVMLASALYYVSNRFGDYWGTMLYSYGGFAACVAAITVVYCLIVPVLLLVPKELTAYADGEVAEAAGHRRRIRYR